MPDKLLTERARQLRQEDTRSEALLWQALRNRKLGGWKWKRQVPRGPFIVDFLCVEAKLVIELAADNTWIVKPMTRGERSGWKPAV